jgi:hypothetical protein
MKIKAYYPAIIGRSSCKEPVCHVYIGNYPVEPRNPCSSKRSDNRKGQGHPALRTGREGLPSSGSPQNFEWVNQL